MHEPHLIEHLTLEVGFAGEQPLPEAETRLAAFMQGPALAIVDAVFDEACAPDEVWRIDALALDLGEVPAERMEELWAQRLRERLAEQLADLHGPAGARRAAAGGVQRSRVQGRREALLHFLQTGHLPWYAQGADPARLADEALQHEGAALAAALRALGDRPRLLHRLVAQFDPAWLAALVQTLLAEQPAIAQRLLQAAHGVPGAALPWGAVLDQALGSAAPTERLAAASAGDSGPGQDDAAAPGDATGLEHLQALLHYLRHGHLPWQARGEDPQRLAAAVLRHDAAALAAALRAMDDRPELLRRLAAQFDADGLAALVHALLPGEPGAAARLLQAAAAAGTGRRSRSGALLWEAVLAQALAHPAAPHALAIALLRAQLRVALETGEGAPESGDPLQVLAAVWAPLLQDDSAWLQATLQRLGDGAAVRQRLTRAVPAALLHALRLLWLGSGPDTAPGARTGRAAAVGAAAALQGPAAPSGAAAGTALAALLDGLRRGQWHAGSDPQHLATKVLHHDGPSLAAALRGMDDRPRLLRRLVAQFEPDWLAALVRALLPGEPAAAARLLQAAAPACAPRRSASTARLWEAVLAQALAPAAQQHTAPRTLLRAQLRLALEAGDPAAPGSDPLLALADAWAPLLHDDLAWLQAELQRLGGGAAVQQRLRHVLPPVLQQPVLALLGHDAPAQDDTLQRQLPGQGPQAAGDAPQPLAAQGLPHSDGAQAGGLPVQRAQLLAALGADLPAASSPALLARVWAPLWQGDRAWLQATLQQRTGSPALQRRIVHALAPEQLPQLLSLWFGLGLAEAMQTWIGQVAAGAPAPAAELSERRQQLWQASLQHALQSGAQSFDADHYAQQVRAHVVATPAPAARWFDRAVRAATALLAGTAAALCRAGRPRPPATPAEPADPAFTLPPPALPAELPVGNAGLVLLAPYHPRLFMMLGLADERAFTGPAEAERAVQLLQLLVTGEADAPEPALVLNKLLCGLDLATPVARRFEPTEAERSAIDGLLVAVVQHWKVLGSTSPAGLRETFLRRAGRLQPRDEAWQLHVVPGPFDMLIDQLPWGYATIKHPWMQEVLHVEWR